MKVQSVDHIQLPIPFGGCPQARRFYEGALGLREIRDPALDRPGMLRFALGGQRLDLIEGRCTGVTHHAHLALQISGLPALTARLVAAGVQVDDSALHDDGKVFLEDPFGHRLELLDTGALQKSQHVTHYRMAI